VFPDEPVCIERESTVSLSAAAAVSMEACMSSPVEHQVMFDRDGLLTSSAGHLLDAQREHLGSQITAASLSLVDCVSYSGL